MSEKRFEYSVEEKGPLIYDNDGVDDYYFLNKPKEMEDFIKLLNRNEEYWQEKYDVLLNRYNKQLKLNIEQDREIRQLKEENEELKKENKHLQCTIESNSQDDYIDFLEKQNEMLKERIEELASNDKIVFMVNE